jgi:hypothetical protein
LAIVTSHWVNPSRPPPIGTEWVPERIEKRPVMMAERLGVHCASTLKFVSRIPSAASWSMRGVAAPRVMPPPYTPGSPRPKLSIAALAGLALIGEIDLELHFALRQRGRACDHRPRLFSGQRSTARQSSGKTLCLAASAHHRFVELPLLLVGSKPERLGSQRGKEMAEANAELMGHPRLAGDPKTFVYYPGQLALPNEL